jgi:SAM-dependent methyltransferase
MEPQCRELFEAATRPFTAAGPYARHFALGKLRYDPVFFGLLRRGLFPKRGRLLDLGCGQGILMVLLAAARRLFQAGQWPQGWPAPPSELEMHGIEVLEARVRAARRALGKTATVRLQDIRQAAFPECSVAVILDVLLYLDDAEQRRILERVAAVLEPGGLLLLREADADAGVSFQVTRWTERIIGMGRGQLSQTLHYRGARQWIGLLEDLGFTVDAEPMSDGTPFCNMLFVARRPSGSTPPMGFERRIC